MIVKTFLKNKINQKSIDEFLQILIVWYWIALYAIVPFISAALLIYIGLFTSYHPLVLIYLCWLYHDKETPNKGGRRSKIVRSSIIWKYFNGYFPLKVIKTADLSLDKNYVFGCFPHGVMPAGMFGCFGNDVSDFAKLYPGLTPYCATLELNFHLALLREHCLCLGGISCCKESLTYILNKKEKGNGVVLAIGGASESLYATPGPYRIVLKDRKGFVKIALETGASLVPVFSFGEIDLFVQNNPQGSKLRTFQEWFKRTMGFSPCWAYGRGILTSSGIAPLKKPITVIIGKPIEVPKISEPSKEDVEKYHSIFIRDLVEIFNEHKSKYAAEGDESQLIIE